MSASDDESIASADLRHRTYDYGRYEGRDWRFFEPVLARMPPRRVPEHSPSPSAGRPRPCQPLHPSRTCRRGARGGLHPRRAWDELLAAVLGAEDSSRSGRGLTCRLVVETCADRPFGGKRL